MSSFGSTLFSGSRFIFWCLGPLFLASGVGCLIGSPFVYSSKGWPQAMALVVMGVCCICFFLALLTIKRFLWAARVVTGIVALSYVLYFADTYFVERQSLSPTTRRSSATPWNAIMGFIVIGVPCLWFTIYGRFGGSAVNDNSKPLEIREPRDRV